MTEKYKFGWKDPRKMSKEELEKDYYQAKVEYITESDPNGLELKQPGAKADAGKSPIIRGLLDYFPRACQAVAQVSARGAAKYSWKGWEKVPDGISRYQDAIGRHLCSCSIEGETDRDTGLYHKAQIAWNALAVLELFLRKKEKEIPNAVTE